MAKLLAKKSVGSAVKRIQVVSTQWWSTLIVDWLMIRLKTYLSLLAEEGDLACNLSDAQWLIVTDFQRTLMPVMLIRKLLEGESHVAINLIENFFANLNM